MIVSGWRDQRPRDGDALALAAGEVGRAPRQEAGSQPDGLQGGHSRVTAPSSKAANRQRSAAAGKSRMLRRSEGCDPSFAARAGCARPRWRSVSGMRQQHVAVNGRDDAGGAT